MDIVYQDERIVVAIKPAGVISTDVRNGMPELLRRQLHTDCIRTVHRLDAPVSGLMVFARSSRAAAEISAQIRDGAFSKAYLAVLRGVPQEMSGELIDLLGRDRERRMTYVADAPGKGVQEARLRYEVLAARDGLSLVRVELLTGRTHQIRAHMAHIGHPLIGDGKYGVNRADRQRGYKYQALCSYRLRFSFSEEEYPVLGYLSGREFRIPRDEIFFTKEFFG